jgi:hypothetical protein
MIIGVFIFGICISCIYDIIFVRPTKHYNLRDKVRFNRAKRHLLLGSPNNIKRSKSAPARRRKREYIWAK